MKIVVLLLTLALLFTPSRGESDFPQRLQVARHFQQGQVPSKDRLRSLVLDGRNLYPDLQWKERKDDIVIIPYLLTGPFTADEVTLIEESLADLSNRAKVVAFVKRSTEQAYVSVQSSLPVCNSPLGRKGGVQELNLGNGCVSKATVQHEFLHALGFQHEHVS